METQNNGMVTTLINEIISINKLQTKFLHSCVKLLSAKNHEEFSSYINFRLATGDSIKYLAQSYDLIVKDTLLEQLFFKRNNRYRYTSFKEVASSVYLNDDYMKKYMSGLALTTYLWPNHLGIKDFFMKVIPKDASGVYLEIGPGHGLYFMKAMQNSAYSHFVGIDLSETSVNLTKSVLESKIFGSFSNYEIVKSDFLKWKSTTKLDAIVMGEVLEHVETPGDFLEKINEIANNHAFIFITTCINSPAVDHIYLYRSMDYIEKQINLAGLRIKERFIEPYANTTLSESESLQLPVNVALVLGKIT